MEDALGRDIGLLPLGIHPFKEQRAEDSGLNMTWQSQFGCRIGDELNPLRSIDNGQWNAAYHLILPQLFG
jgi:hypothetical protein